MLAALLAPLRTYWLMRIAVALVARGLHMTPHALASDIGLAGRPVRFAPLALLVMVGHVAAAAVLLLSRPDGATLMTLPHWRHTAAPTMAATTTTPTAGGPADAESGELVLHGARLAEAVLLGPLKEELMFRGLVATVLRNRMSGLRAAWQTNAAFAALHAVNAVGFGGRGAMYVAAQVALAFAMGLFMSLRLLLGGSLWECAVLHVVNNCTAALFPPGELPGGSTGALLTLFAYMLLNAKLSRVLRREADKAE